MLEAAGKSVHVYTSPHLVRVNERFRLGAAAACWSPTRTCRCTGRCERANGDAPITLFEIETAAAFLLFARIRPTCCCSKSASAGGSTPPM